MEIKDTLRATEQERDELRAELLFFKSKMPIGGTFGIQGCTIFETDDLTGSDLEFRQKIANRHNSDSADFKLKN